MHPHQPVMPPCVWTFRAEAPLLDLQFGSGTATMIWNSSDGMSHPLLAASAFRASGVMHSSAWICWASTPSMEMQLVLGNAAEWRHNRGFSMQIAGTLSGPKIGANVLMSQVAIFSQVSTSRFGTAMDRIANDLAMIPI